MGKNWACKNAMILFLERVSDPPADPAPDMRRT